jgi:hypothetical protein
MFNEISRLLEALCENWREKVLSINMDGDRSMVGSVRGLAARMENVAKPGYLSVWCRLHQVDLFMQRGFKALKWDSFYKELLDVISCCSGWQYFTSLYG